MKKYILFVVSILTIIAMLASCSSALDAEPVITEVLATELAIVSAEAAAKEDIAYEGDASTCYIDVAYPEQIGRYHTALSEGWDEGKYFEHDLSALPSYYCKGNPLDNDGRLELIIGAIMNAETAAPVVFESWTLLDGI